MEIGNFQYLQSRKENRLQEVHFISWAQKQLKSTLGRNSSLTNTKTSWASSCNYLDTTKAQAKVGNYNDEKSTHHFVVHLLGPCHPNMLHLCVNQMYQAIPKPSTQHVVIHNEAFCTFETLNALAPTCPHHRLPKCTYDIWCVIYLFY